VVYQMNKVDSNTSVNGFDHIYKNSVINGYGFVMYRLPKSETVHLLVDTDGGKNLHDVDLDELPAGFVLHPFSTEKHSIKFLKRDLHLIRKRAQEEVSMLHSNVPEFLMQQLLDKPPENTSGQCDASHKQEAYASDYEKEDFLELVQIGRQAVENGAFQKVVISRQKQIKLPKNPDNTKLFDMLCDRYTNAFVHLTHLPGTGTWIGATPELLVGIDQQNQFQTVALAATQKLRGEADIADTTWSQKDIEEQALVSRYIINCFKRIRLREFEEIGPRTSISGNLVHLKTSFRVDLNQVSFPELGTVMLRLLHPTSAVCGMPKEPAEAFIMHHERFDRAYFSGFLGPVNMSGETSVFVNLRCARLHNDCATLYAGAGIIANSNPQKEWEETENKMDTIASVLLQL
jgi:isochorismate synthase